MKTLKPDLYAHLRDGLEGPMYEGHDLSLANMDTVWSVGATPHDAIKAFCEARMGESESLEIVDVLEGGDESYTWGYRFSIGGTSCKAAGIHVAGGCLLTWWK